MHLYLVTVFVILNDFFIFLWLFHQLSQLGEPGAVLLLHTERGVIVSDNFAGARGVMGQVFQAEVRGLLSYGLRTSRTILLDLRYVQIPRHVSQMPVSVEVHPLSSANDAVVVAAAFLVPNALVGGGRSRVEELLAHARVVLLLFLYHILILFVSYTKIISYNN